MTELTKAQIVAAMHSSIEGIVFLVVDSLEFDLNRQLTDAEQQDVDKLVEFIVGRGNER